MSKVASYLQEHLSGEVTVNADILDMMSRDGSIFQLKPEMVVYPRTTNDIRKIARFCWQLAERGHTLSITARGSGTDPTGAAIGKGIILSFPAHMNAVFEFESRQKLVRLQPGVSTGTLKVALGVHGASIPALPEASHSIGGTVANNISGSLAGKYGQISNYVEQLEVILANGEVIQTGRISKRELNRKKGLETLEGEIYRSIDNLIVDNKDLINLLKDRLGYTSVGYVSIAAVKKKDGSFDLTPLLIGSQGTLGIISEMILSARYISSKQAVIQGLFEDKDSARDCLPALMKLSPTFLYSYDEGLIEQAAKAGKKYEAIKTAEFAVGKALLFGFDDYSDRKRRKMLKKAEKLIRQFGGTAMFEDGEQQDGLQSFQDILYFSSMPSGKGESAPAILQDIYIPAEQYSVFSAGMALIGSKHHVSMPIFGNELSSLYSVWPTFSLAKTTDKQKIFKVLDDVSQLVEKTGGELIGNGGEGRLKTRAVGQSFDEDAKNLFQAIKSIFDPYGILNPDVKQSSEIKNLAGMLRNGYLPPGLPNHLPLS